MTTYSTSFASYTADVQPSDWTARWVTANNNWLTRSKSNTDGGKVLENTGTVDGRHLLSWDAVDADANRANAEILARVRSSTFSGDQFRLTVRGSGAAAAETSYNLVFNTAGTSLQLHKYVAGVSTNVGTSFSLTPVVNVWYLVRFRVNGTTLQGKVWRDGEAEPSAWTVTATDSGVSAAGWVGVGNVTATGTRDIDWFSVGTNGDTAPLTSQTDNTEKVSQAVVEVANNASAPAVISQAVMEVANNASAPAVISQAVMEVAFGISPTPQISQVVIEVAVTNVVAVTQQPRMIVVM